MNQARSLRNVSFLSRRVIMGNLTDIGVIKDIINRYGFSFSKNLGQNFLINPSVCPKIAEFGNANENFGIIEIGTGFGVLTAELAKRAKKVVAIEIDPRLIPVLDETLAEYHNVRIINKDVLKVDLHRLISDEFAGLSVAVCANLPYNLTSPIIMYLLEQRLPLKSITVMVQKEAGQRLCARLGTRETGAVSVAINYFAAPKMLFNVSRGSFIPRPNVDSCVIRLDIREKTPEGVENEAFFFKTVRGAFSQRRKTLCNSVSAAFDISKDMVSQVILDAGLNADIRPEQMKMEDFIRFSNLLYRSNICL